MAEITVREASAADINNVLRRLRPEHLQGIRESTYLEPGSAVWLSVEDSCAVFSGKADGIVLFIAGVSRKRLFSNAGSVWMLATPEIDNHPLEAATALRRLFGRAHRLAGAKTLEQWIPAWYRKGIKWLLWLGWEARDTIRIKGYPHIHMTHSAMEDA